MNSPCKLRVWPPFIPHGGGGRRPLTLTPDPCSVRRFAKRVPKSEQFPYVSSMKETRINTQLKQAKGQAYRLKVQERIFDPSLLDRYLSLGIELLVVWPGKGSQYIETALC